MAHRPHTDYSKGDRVVWVSKNDPDTKFKGTYVGWNDDKEMARVEREEDNKAILIPLERLQKQRGRPAGSSNKEKPHKEKKNGKVSPLSFEEVCTMQTALDTMKSEMVEMSEAMETILTRLAEHASWLKKQDSDTDEESENEKKPANKFLPKLVSSRKVVKEDTDESDEEAA